MEKMKRKHVKFHKSVNVFLLTLAVLLFNNGVLVANGANTEKSVGVDSAVNTFAFDLYKQIQTTKGNFVFSPYSIVTALSMTYVGARGNTQVQMRDVLHIGSVDEFIHSGLFDIDRQLQRAQKKKQFELYVANALWMEKEHSFLNTFLEFQERYYDATMKPVDFKYSSKQTVKIINQWVEKKTDGKIRDLVEPGAIDASTTLVLTNTIFFKGIWETLFDPHITKNLPFSLSEKEILNVPTMYQNAEFGYLAEELFQMIKLPYMGNELSMIVFLPWKTNGLPELEFKLNAALLSSYQARMKKKEIHVFLPRFRSNTPLALSRFLKEMGMTDAFSTRADFSGMDGTRSLLIGKVFHSTLVETDEQGTMASSGTAVVMKPGGTSLIEPPLIFKADHPFMFLIIHEPSGTILFIGRVVNPLEKRVT